MKNYDFLPFRTKRFIKTAELKIANDYIKRINYPEGVFHLVDLAVTEILSFI